MRALPLLLSVAALACAAAPERSEDDRHELAPSSGPSESAATPTSTPRVVAKTAIEQAVDNEEPLVSFSWGLLSFRTRADWRATALLGGKLVMAAEKGPFVAAFFVDPSEADAVGALERALHVDHCSWLPEATAKVGRAALDARIVDGVCEREGRILSLARVRYAGSGVGFFMWEGDADPGPLWPIARSVDDLTPQRLSPCCRALSQQVKGAPGVLIDRYQRAADICTLDRAGANPDTLAKIKAVLLDASLPAACR